jgi:chemotaxis signal transduction protein
LIQSQIRKDYIKGVGKLKNRLIIFLDLEKVLAPSEVEQLTGMSKGKEEEGR